MRSTAACIVMLGAARALVARGPLRAGARQLRTSQPLRMAASTLEGLRNVAIVAHVDHGKTTLVGLRSWPDQRGTGALPSMQK